MIMQYRGTRWIVLAMALMMAVGRTVAHEGHAHLPPQYRLAAASEPIANLPKSDPGVEETLTYFYELYTALAGELPTDVQDEAIRRATALSLDRTEPPVLSASVEAAQAFYDRLRSEYPVVPIAWGEDTVIPDDALRPVPIAAGLPRIVLVEVENVTSGPVTLTAAFRAESSTLTTVPPGATRALAVRLDASAGETVAILHLSQQSGPATNRVLAVPVVVDQPATIVGTLLDTDAGEVWPGRVAVRGSDGVFRDGKAYADIETVSQKQILQFPGKFYKLPFFYSDGTFEVVVPPGDVDIAMERGLEHDVSRARITVEPGERREVTLSSGRFIDMKGLGWVSGDTHVHWVKNHWSENEELDLLRVVQRAEDVRVVNNLLLLHRTANLAFITPNHFPMGPVPGMCDGEYHVQMAEEYRNEEFYGHLCFLNIHRLVLPISTGKAMAGPDAPDYPINKTAIMDCRSQGGISIEAHGLGLNWDVPVNVIQGLTDSLDQISPPDYYRFLNCGFRLPLTNGSDHPARVLGCARAYVKVDGGFTYENWIDGIRKCRTFTTSGPLLFLSVNGADIGDVLDVPKGTPLRIRARALSRKPLGNVEIASNGEVIHSVRSEEREAELAFEISADEPRWFVARCSQNGIYSAIAAPDVAHTSAIYVNVDGQPVFKQEAARFWAERMREHVGDVAKRGVFVNDAQRQEAIAHIEAGVRMFEEAIDNSASGE